MRTTQVRLAHQAHTQLGHSCDSVGRRAAAASASRPHPALNPQHGGAGVQTEALDGAGKWPTVLLEHPAVCEDPAVLLRLLATGRALGDAAAAAAAGRLRVALGVEGEYASNFKKEGSFDDFCDGESYYEDDSRKESGKLRRKARERLCCEQAAFVERRATVLAELTVAVGSAWHSPSPLSSARKDGPIERVLAPALQRAAAAGRLRGLRAFQAPAFGLEGGLLDALALCPALTRLRLGTFGQEQKKCDLCCVYIGGGSPSVASLRGLRELDLAFGCEPPAAPAVAGLSALTRLTRLRLTLVGLPESATNVDKQCIELNRRWSGLHDLPASLLDLTLAARSEVRGDQGFGGQAARQETQPCRNPGPRACSACYYWCWGGVGGNRFETHRTFHLTPRQDKVADAAYDAGEVHTRMVLEPGLLTHLTRLTRLCTRPDLMLPNDPDALPSAGSSLRVLVLACDATSAGHEPRPCIEALLPVAAGLDALDVAEWHLTPGDAARLAAALPRDIAQLRIKADDPSLWAALPLTGLTLEFLPADLALLAGPPRLWQLSVSIVEGVDPAALAAALQALPRLRALQLGDGWHRPFQPFAWGADAGAAAPPTAEAVDAFVAAVAGLPSLRELSLEGFHIGRKAKAALLQAAPRLSALRLAVSGTTNEAAAALAAQMRAAAGRGALSLAVRAWPR
jgi:hypothetical protein